MRKFPRIEMTINQSHGVLAIAACDLCTTTSCTSRVELVLSV